MADQVRVNLEENSKYRVAYDLMRMIAHLERMPKDREYFLRLYRQCYESVYAVKNIDEVVKGKASAATSGV